MDELFSFWENIIETKRLHAIDSYEVLLFSIEFYSKNEYVPTARSGLLHRYELWNE